MLITPSRQKQFNKEVTLSFTYSLKFHPVGQGLFSSGTVSFESERSFNFVYDCGTSSQQKLLGNAISSISLIGDIDLLTISHFDKDHISGLEILLSRHRIKVLLIPYLTFEQRIIVAFSNNIAISSKLMDFYLDPLRYLLERYGERIGEIVLVPSIPNEDEKYETVNDNEQDSGLQIDIDSDIDTEYQTSVRVRKLKYGGCLTYKNKFEFVPYNDASVAYKATSSFKNNVKKEKLKLINSSTVNDIHASLARMRDCYDKFFGRSSINRNIISLFLFAGPCAKSHCFQESYFIQETNSSERIDWESEKDGVLFSGDGYLNTKKKLNSLINFFGENRISRISCFQVMHHGARGCWHNGIAKSLSPNISVFSSNPEHKSLKHPHAEVVKDFLPYNPVQVDKVSYLEIYYRLY